MTLSDTKYLYWLIVALDANFKLKNRIPKNEYDDPSLGPGWGAFVEPCCYKKHLREYIAEKDVHVPSALTQKKQEIRLACEFPASVDVYVHTTSVCGPTVRGIYRKGSGEVLTDEQEYTVSYDIACQWKKHFNARMEKLPKALQRNFSKLLVKCGLPVWHALTHEEECTNENNLNLLPGVGKSDGEGIECLWAILNALSFQTKEMSLGNRADTMEGKLDSHNFLKSLGHGDTLRWHLVVAITERARQVEVLKEINKTIKLEKRVEWQAQINCYLEDRSVPNPYVMKKKDGPSEADICVKLRIEEQADAANGQAPLHATSATVFLTAGLQLEETQYVFVMAAR
ncbi:hypothetical protein B0H16DRAFT_1485748 [Mycena metata]|uniref:Uncharacterized protein n=1 Tax=Mycena metata TaxID=1033252 RepID=A0AAD7DL49_9AGAR|nr:hypothetical protein B0H16DRAFT_1485748 [Mycena metata]